MVIKRIILLAGAIFSSSAFGGNYINALGCKIFLPGDFEAYYKSDGSLSFNYGGSSINLSKFSGYLRAGVVGNDELTTKEFREHGLNIIIGTKENKITKSIMHIVQISDGVIRLSIIGDMAKDWNGIVRECDSQQ